MQNTIIIDLKSYEDLYVPRCSCFICMIPDCNISDPNCYPVSRTDVLPIYNILLEFGFFYENTPEHFFANVTVAKGCIFQIYGYKDTHLEEHYHIKFRECRPNGVPSCHDFHEDTEKGLTDDKSCIFFSIKFFNTTEIYSSFSRDCDVASISKLCHKVFDNAGYQCPFNETSNLTVQYAFLHSNRTLADGVPLLVPCSPGGYAVDPLTGRFITGNFCRNLFPPERIGIKEIMDKFYKLDDDYIFPFSNEKLTQRIPIYIDVHNKPKPVSKMRHKKIVCELPILRDGCNVTLLPLSEEMKNDPRCRKAAESFNIEKKEKLSNILFDLPPVHFAPYEYGDIKIPEEEKKKDEGGHSSQDVASGCLETHGCPCFSIIIILTFWAYKFIPF